MEQATQTAPSQATQSLDCTGQLCPMPIYKTSMVMKQLAAGDLLEVVCTDPGSLKDFPAFAHQGGHELVASEERDGRQIFLLRKGGGR